jgi:hypothetical protein
VTAPENLSFQRAVLGDQAHLEPAGAIAACIAAAGFFPKASKPLTANQDFVMDPGEPELVFPYPK